jgi:excisionase family DNA binding protein
VRVTNQKPRPDEPGRSGSLPVLLTPPELAARLGITERHVRRLVLERRIPFVKVGRFVRFEEGPVSDWLDLQRVAAVR